MGGGGNTATKAWSMLPSFWRMAMAIALALCPSGTRSLNGLSGTKMVAALEVGLKLMMERPGKATVCATPGTSRISFSACRVTAVVRSSEAAGGSWITPIK